MKQIRLTMIFIYITGFFLILITPYQPLKAQSYGLYEGNITDWLDETEKAQRFIITQFTRYLIHKRTVPRKRAISNAFREALFQCVNAMAFSDKLPKRTLISQIVESCTVALMNPTPKKS